MTDNPFEFLFGNSFDFDHNGEMDDFESRAAFTSFLEGMLEEKGIDKSLSDMSADEIDKLASESGIDCSDFGL